MLAVLIVGAFMRWSVHCWTRGRNQ